MNKTFLRFLLVLLVECVSAFVEYLKDILHQHMRSDDAFGADSEMSAA